MHSILLLIKAAFCALVFCVAPWGFTPAHAQTEVDLELVLLVDVSRSMSEEELEIQRRGYAEALQSDEIYKAIRRGFLGRIALSYVEWAGTQQVIVDWRLLETPEDLRAFATTLTAQFNPALRRTSITNALLFGAAMFDDNGFTGLRRVIDISGDGPNNQGGLVTQARDHVVAQGITINGLPLMTNDGFGPQWHLDNLDLYYQTCVIGGPGAFVIPVYNWRDFAGAVRRKMILEIAAPQVGPRLWRAQTPLRDPRDCLVGEKIWQDFQRNWGNGYSP